MTAAFNLSQFANRLNTTGQIDPTSAFSAALPISQGGTNNASLAVTAGGVIYTDGSKMVNVGAGSSGQFLRSNGAGAPTWQTPTGGGFTNIQIYTSGSGSWTIPSGITTCKITVVGGGGGGGGTISSFYASGGGGGAGGAAIRYYTSITPGNTINYTVGGGGGGGGTGGSGSASAGGASSVSSGTQTITTISATGGSGGGNYSGSRLGGAGGVGSGGSINQTGGTGMTFSGGSSTANTNFVVPYGGTSIFGAGGYFQDVNSRGSQAGQNYGSGGSGGTNGNGGTGVTGGAGAGGVVIIEY